MNIWGNKKIKFLSFEIWDSETLEQYLNEMAKEGWLLKNIGNIHLTFEKTDKRNFKYNVDPLGNNFIVGDFLDRHSYIEYCKEHNWEYICGNEYLKISISDKNNMEKIKSTINIKPIIRKDMIELISIIMLFIFLVISNHYYSKMYFMDFVSDYSMISTYILSAIIFLINFIIVYFFKVSRYINYFKNKTIKSTKLKKIKFKSLFNLSFFLVAITLILGGVVITSSEEMSQRMSYSKESLPITLEDYNIEIQSERESISSEQSTFLAKYSTFSDDTYYYENHTEDGVEVETEYGAGNLYYEIFESKYKNIINKALESEIKKKSSFGFKYKKYVSGEELNNWGANEIYIENLTGERIVVYDNKILILGIEGKYDKENINFIKDKLLKI